MKLEHYISLVSGILVGFGLIFIVLIWNFSGNFTKKISENKLLFDQPDITTPSPTPTPIQPIRLLFVGDLMFDRTIRSLGQATDYEMVLANLTEELAEYTAVIGNLETPVTDNPSVSLGSAVGSSKNFIFTSEPAILPVLKKNNITIVNLGNNHIGNFGEPGFRSTLDYLEAHGIRYFGNTSYSKEKTYLIQEFGPLRVGLVNYNQFIDDGYTRTLDDIRAVLENRVDILIVVAHWDNEYETTPAPITVERAHAFVDAGADAVIGGHPHVIAAIEDYKGKRIYYSLGNFVFDQYFSEPTKIGLAVEMIIAPDTREITYSSFETITERDGTTRLFVR